MGIIRLASLFSFMESALLDILIAFAFFAFWFAVIGFLLPKFGVGT